MGCYRWSLILVRDNNNTHKNNNDNKNKDKTINQEGKRKKASKT